MKFSQRSLWLRLLRTYLVFTSIYLSAGAISDAADVGPAQAAPSLDDHGSNFGVTLLLARAARAAGDLTAAIPLYRQIALAPKADPALAVEYGDILLEAGLIDDAIGAYESVRGDSRSETDALLGLRNAYARLGQPQAALEYARRAGSLSPRNERAEIALGVSLDRMNRHVEAQAAYRTALAIAPRSIAARNDLALSLALTGQFPEAIALMSPIASSTNASGQARQNMALIRGLEGDRAAALAWGETDLPAKDAEANARLFDLARPHPRPNPSADPPQPASHGAEDVTRAN